MSSAKRECTEIDTGNVVQALAFMANGEYLVSGGREGVRVWRVEDGKLVATLKMRPGSSDSESVAVSKDCRFIAAGTHYGDVLVWDATNYEQVFAVKIGSSIIRGVDFSPDSTKLVSAHWGVNTATIWDIVARKKVHALDHDGPGWVAAAKYSPQGDRIATATGDSIRVWDGDNGRLLVDIKSELQLPRCLLCLLWFNNHLFIRVKGNIKRIDTSTGLTISEWSVPLADISCIALPRHGKFIACATRENIAFWDSSTHKQLDVFSQRSNGCLMALSPDDRLLAIPSENEIIFKDLSPAKDLDIRIENAAFDAWKNNQLANAEMLLNATVSDTAHHVFASRALVRARLKLWDAALADAEESIKIQSSVLGYIAKCAVLVGMGETLQGRRVCDAALLRYSDHLSLLLLIKAVIFYMAGEHDDAISRLADLISTANFFLSSCVVQAYMHLLIGNLHMESGDYERAIQWFEDARVKLGNHTGLPPLIVSLISGWKFDGLTLTIQQRLCEALFSAGRVIEAGEFVLRMIDEEIDTIDLLKTWLSEFMQRCLSALSLVTVGDDNMSHLLTQLSRGWARLRLSAGSWKETLTAASFILPRFTIYQVICEYLEETGQVADAVACFHRARSELGRKIDSEHNWIRDFELRCCAKLEDIADIAVNAREYDEAILHYSTALSLNSMSPQGLLVKRSKAYTGNGMWKDALADANEIIKFDPSSLSGYERKYAALHGMGCHHDATRVFETMLLKMSESSDPVIRERSRSYVRPEKTREAIRATIDNTTRDSPLVLIDTLSGRLCNKSEQASAFEKTTTFTELISSTTTHIDDIRIEQQVGEYYRYATFSHKWEENEPLFEKVIRIVVYELEASPTHEKLKMFCKIVREAGFNWAWSDTCCINKGDHFVLQESLVSMFKWYERSSMTIIYLLGVDCRALRGALTRSIWNMRAWTLQEYHASKVVRIYTEDWTPYLGLTAHNHKESPEVILEMEEATGISAQALMSLRPGLDDIREKLRLASTRRTTRVEDAAYSLLGIFSVSLPITYGERDGALGRLLAQLLASSGDTSILAWTGISGSFNSCLPANITVFNELPTTHIPPANSDVEISAGLRSLNTALVMKLYDRVNELHVPSFSGRRMRLPCVTFKLGPVSISEIGSERVFRAQTKALGTVEIRTEEDLSQLGSLTLIHPWIDFLLDRQPLGSVIPQPIAEENSDDAYSVLGELPSFPGPSATRQSRASRVMSRIGLPFGGRSSLDTGSLRPPSSLSPAEKRTDVLRFLARLQRPFGALLLTPTRSHVEEYKRVAAESLITVQVQEITPAILEKLTRDVRMLDVL